MPETEQTQSRGHSTTECTIDRREKEGSGFLHGVCPQGAASHASLLRQLLFIPKYNYLLSLFYNASNINNKYNKNRVH